MAAGVLTVQKMTLGGTTAGVYSGTTPTFAAATVTDGDKVTPGNASKTFIICKQTGTTVYVKLVGQSVNNQGLLADVGDASAVKGIPVSSSALVYIGPLDDPSLRDVNGAITIVASSVTTLSLAAVELAEKGRG